MYDHHIDDMVKELFVGGVITELQKDDAKKALQRSWEGKIACTWTRADVYSMAEMEKVIIDEEAADEILQDVLNGFNAEYGINWESFRCAVQDGEYVHDSLVRAEIAKVTEAGFQELPLLINEVSTEEAKDLLKERLNPPA